MQEYRKLGDLPQSMRDELPEKAQHMYLAVYQRVWETEAMGGDRSPEKIGNKAHEAAMLEVQRRFDRDEQGNWVEAPVGDEIDTDKLEGGVPDARR